MKKLKIAMIVAALSCVACTACADMVQKSGNDISAEEVSLLDRKGDTSVPKTAEEIIGDDGVCSYSTAEAMEKDIGFGISVLEEPIYADVIFVTDGNGSAGIIYTDGECSVTVYKNREALMPEWSSYSYRTVMDVDGQEVQILGRLGEGYVGSATWEGNDGYYYMIETSAWDELSDEDITDIIMQTK